MMRIGIVCPYSFAVPGGVQAHISQLRAELVKRGHEVQVLAPGQGAEAGPTSDLEDQEWLTLVEGAIAIPYNGSVARLNFGPKAVRATRAWLQTYHFDVVHVHEPTTPSLSMLALAHAECPVIATFHAAMEYSLALRFGARILAPLLEKIAGRIAVSPEARRTLIQHQGGDAVIIPNGIDTSVYQGLSPQPGARPRVSFLGRLDEERKGLAIFLAAMEQVWQDGVECEAIVAGRGESAQLQELAQRYPDRLSVRGEISDREKAQLLTDSDIYVAPQTGGESFGIVLVEAMAGGACVVASDIPAFTAVLGDGKYGALFANTDPSALAGQIASLLADPSRRSRLAAAGQARAQIYDWQRVTDQIELTYLTVTGAQAPAVAGRANGADEPGVAGEGQ